MIGHSRSRLLWPDIRPIARAFLPAQVQHSSRPNKISADLALIIIKSQPLMKHSIPYHICNHLTISCLICLHLNCNFITTYLNVDLCNYYALNYCLNNQINSFSSQNLQYPTQITQLTTSLIPPWLYKLIGSKIPDGQRWEPSWVVISVRELQANL